MTARRFLTLLLLTSILSALTADGVPTAAEPRTLAGDPWRRHPAVASFDVDPSGLPAALFLVRARADIAPTPGVTIHGHRGDTYLVSGPRERLSDLSRRGCSIYPLDVSPIPATPPRRWVTIDEPVTAISAMVDEVNWEDVEEIVTWLAGFGTRFSFARNHRRVAESVRDRFATIGLEPVMRSYTLSGETLWNVEATHVGTVYPESYYIMCGHFDSISDRPAMSAPGADDNATGIAAIMTAARILSQHDFEYSIRFICFSGEEQILKGSQDYAAWARENDLDIMGVVNYDMIGWWEPGVPRNLEIETNGASQWLAEAIVNATRLYTETPYKLHVYDGAWWGDHASFWGQGYPAVNHEESWDWYDPDFNPRYHTTQDLPEYLHPGFTVDNVKVAVASLATLAGYVAPPLPVTLDIRPGSAPNPFNPKSNGVVPALITGGHDIDIQRVDAATVRLEGVAPLTTRVCDETGDGFSDLRMKFSTADLAAAIGGGAKHATVTLRLTGLLDDGTRIEGEDVVTVVGGSGPRASEAAGAVPTAVGRAVPNPFNPVTRIPFTLAHEGHVRLLVFDARGRLVTRLVDGVRPAGPNDAVWSAGGRPSGVYFYRFEANGVSETRKLILLK